MSDRRWDFDLVSAVRYCGLSKETFLRVQPRMNERNLRVLSFSSALLGLCGVLFLTITLVASVGNPYLYVIQIMAGLFIALMRRRVSSQNTTAALMLCYMLALVTFAYAIALSFLPENITNPSVSLVAFFVLMPFTILDVAWRMYAFVGTSTAAFLTLSMILKPSAVAFTDTIDALTFVGLSMLLYTYVTNQRVRDLCEDARDVAGGSDATTLSESKGALSLDKSSNISLDMPVDRKPAKPHRGFVPKAQVINLALAFVGAILCVVGMTALVSLTTARTTTANTRDQYEECVAASKDFMEASDFLTTEARMFAMTGDLSHADAYFGEFTQGRRRNHAVEVIQKYGKDSVADRELSKALDYSNQLADLELYGMRLVADGNELSAQYQNLGSVELSPEHADMLPDEKIALGQQLLFDEEFADLKARVVSSAKQCSDALLDGLWSARMDSLGNEMRLHNVLFATLILFVLLLIASAVSNYLLVMRPLGMHVESIRENEPLQQKGSAEVRNVAESYNHLFEENERRTLLLKRQAQTDPLTGLFNRGSFNSLIEGSVREVALIMADVDLFKDINDNYGHEVGDKVLIKVAEALRRRFRSTDYACRVGGDEFAVVLMGMSGQYRETVAKKLRSIYADLATALDGLPATTLSVGIAFGDELPEGMSLYHAADIALYEAKNNGRNQFVFYDGTKG